MPISLRVVDVWVCLGINGVRGNTKKGAGIGKNVFVVLNVEEALEHGQGLKQRTA